MVDEKDLKRYPDLTIEDVEPKLKHAVMGSKGDRHDYIGSHLSCRESGVVLAELTRLRTALAAAQGEVERLRALEQQYQRLRNWIRDEAIAANSDQSWRRLHTIDVAAEKITGKGKSDG